MIFGKKPRMMAKFKKHFDRHKNNNFIVGGQKEFAPWSVILNYDNKCNLKCQHCFTKSSLGDFGKPTLTIDDVKNLADQADELGVYEFDIQGGEPLMNKDLFKILEVIDTSRFYTYITTNGWFLDEQMAQKLADAGVDKVDISIDSFTPEEHDEFRGRKGVYERAMKAAEYVQKAGMRAYFSITVGSYNAQSKELEDFTKFAASKNIGIVVNCASPSGAWKGNYDIMMNDKDSKKIEELRKNNPEIIRDNWNILNTKELVVGCPTVNFFYINPYGDVLPCVYIHTTMGNIKEKPLKEILLNGFNYKYFNTLTDKCLSGENKEFAKKYLSQNASVMSPVPIEEFFENN